MTAPVGLFYGSTTCYTEMIAERIQSQLGEDIIDLNNISHVSVFNVNNYKYLIFGIPTWDYGELQEDWDLIWDDLCTLDLNGKFAAVFGLGDQVGYGQWFQDALGYLALQLKSSGAALVGLWPNEGYDFVDSKGLTPDRRYFYGLALDEETQADQTEIRLSCWLKQLPFPPLQSD